MGGRSLSDASPECPGSIHEGGELGYLPSHSFGAVFDNPALIVAGVVVGNKVGAGAKALAGHPGEQVTKGLDGLLERLADYAARGAPFARSRAVLTIGQALPSRACMLAHALAVALALALARYAAARQEAQLVPSSNQRCYAGRAQSGAVR